MELILERIAKRQNYTIGRLSLSPDPSPSREGSATATESPLPLEGDRGRLLLLEGDRGRLYFCDTLEPPALEVKTTVPKDAVLRSPKKTQSLKPFAIPEGRYAVVITYSPKFKQWLPLLLGGPDFSRLFKGIRIHAGNTVEDTQGCILVGRNPAIERGKTELASTSEREQGRPEVNQRVGQVLESRKWLYELKQKIVEAKARGEAVWLTIK